MASRSMLEGNEFFQVPEVIDELSGGRVLAMELVHGVPLDRCVDLDQETRNQVGVDSTGTWIPWCTGDREILGVYVIVFIILWAFEVLQNILQKNYSRMEVNAA